MSRPFLLYRLQGIDTQLDKARQRLQEIEKLLAEDEAIQQAKARLETAEADLSMKQKALRHAEDEVQAQRIKIEQTESTLYSGRVHNPKELQDMQNEAAALKRFRSVLEDRQLEAMIAAEEAGTAHQLSVSALEAAVAQSALKNQSLTEEQGSLQHEASRLETERQAAAGSILQDDLSLYGKLPQQRRAIAVARLSGSSCSACGSTLNSALLSAARSPNNLTRCAGCGRILYAP
jgi:predicted  nucleic acid-binding Zn-ribbon protein